jgi:S-adenosylmethionine:tRNA ribosyltransferase-isomerase
MANKEKMLLSDFDYYLPDEKIAQEPADKRDSSRLMIVPRQDADFEHHQFNDFYKYLKKGDVLVLNDTRVIPARLRGKKESGGKIEVLLDRPLGEHEFINGQTISRWICLVRASKPFRQGSKARLSKGAELISEGPTADNKAVIVGLTVDGPLDTYLDECGEIPLPAYIKRSENETARFDLDKERYQTVYARHPGAVAAPTAGFHFTEQVLEQLESIGVEIAYVTLHVGPGTFLPVRTQNVEDHKMHAERWSIGSETAGLINRAKQENRRVVAVGTTSVRTLESACDGIEIVPRSGETDLFIVPGYDFKIVDAMLTNFHLPQSTLLMLVSAFAGRKRILAAYQQAVEMNYRFYSYGDAMFLF